MQKYRFVFITLPVLAMLASCGGQSSSEAAREDAIEGYAASHGIDLDATVQDGETTIRPGGMGSVTMGNVQSLPDGFPDDIPMMSSIKLQSISVMPNGFLVVGQSETSQADIIEFYRSGMTGAGWSVASETSTGPMQALSFEKDNRRTGVNVIATAETNIIQVTTTTLEF